MLTEYTCSECGKRFETPQARSGHSRFAHGVSQGITEKELSQELLRLSTQLDKTPTADEMRELGEFSVRTYQNHFGSWNEAIETVGYR